MSSTTTISHDKLSRLIGIPTSPVLIDVRIDEDFALDPRLIPGSRRRAHKNIESWTRELDGKRAVIVCQQGKKLSEGTAALLRCSGIIAETLDGGYEAWIQAGLPAIPAAKLPPLDQKGRTVWVTRARPKVDRIACPWLIRRFVGPDAVFLFVAPSEVEAVADRFNAAAFDIEGVFWSHREELCTFDVLVEELGLRSEALSRLATIVRGADTARPDLAPEVPGLLAASLGLSRMFSEDIEQLEAGMTLYDAFYRWCRDATDETHNWPNRKPGA